MKPKSRNPSGRTRNKFCIDFADENLSELQDMNFKQQLTLLVALITILPMSVFSYATLFSVAPVFKLQGQKLRGPLETEAKNKSCVADTWTELASSSARENFRTGNYCMTSFFDGLSSSQFAEQPALSGNILDSIYQLV